MAGVERGGVLATRWWSRSWVDVVACTLAAGLAAVFVVRAFLSAMSQDEHDFHGYFLPAAQAVLVGGSPYSVEGFYYTPLVPTLLAPFSHAEWAQAAWTVAILAAACGTVFFGVLVSTPRWRWRHRAWLFGIALVTLFWSWPMTMEFFWGQVNLFVTFAITLAAYLATRVHYFSVGLALGLAAAIKSWPVFLVLWIFRRGGRRRWRTALGVAIVAAVTVVLALAFGGLPTLGAMLAAPLQGTDQPDVVAYSAWGLGKALFGGFQWAQPIVDSPLLRGATTTALLGVLIALLAVALRWPGTEVILLFNLGFGVLLMPIAHQQYLFLALPALWWWIARAAQMPRHALNWVVVGVLLGWWVMCFRLFHQLPPMKETVIASVTAVVLSTLVAAAASIVGAALSSRQDQVSGGISGEGTGLAGGGSRPATRSTHSRNR